MSERMSHASAPPGTPAPSAPAASAPQYGWLLGRVGGVPVYLAKSWVVIAGVIVLSFGTSVGLPQPTGYAVAAAYALLLLVSILVHEAGHAIAARAFGAPVNRIVANLWGGHTVFSSASLTPRSSAAIAAAGPLGNVLLAAVGWGLWQVLDARIPSLLAGALTFANVFVAIFNLLPGLPLDGGALVEAAVWGATGSRARGMIVAGWSGRVLTVVVGAWFAAIQPLLAGRMPDTFTVVWVLLIGSFLWRGASAAIAVGRTRLAVGALRVGDVIRPVVTVPMTASAATASAGLVATPEAQYAVLVDPLGRPVAAVDIGQLLALPEDSLAGVAASAISVGLAPSWVIMSEVGAEASAVVQRLAGDGGEDRGMADVLVVDAAHRVVGTVSMADVERRLLARP